MYPPGSKPRSLSGRRLSQPSCLRRHILLRQNPLPLGHIEDDKPRFPVRGKDIADRFRTVKLRAPARLGLIPHEHERKAATPRMPTAPRIRIPKVPPMYLRRECDRENASLPK